MLTLPPSPCALDSTELEMLLTTPDRSFMPSTKTLSATIVVLPASPLPSVLAVIRAPLITSNVFAESSINAPPMNQPGMDVSVRFACKDFSASEFFSAIE